VRIEDVALDPNPAPAIRRVLDFLDIFTTTATTSKTTAASTKKKELTKGEYTPPQVPSSGFSTPPLLHENTEEKGHHHADHRHACQNHASAGVLVDESSLQSAVEAVAARVKGKYAGAYGGNKHGNYAAREKLLVNLGLRNRHHRHSGGEFVGSGAGSDGGNVSGVAYLPGSGDSGGARAAANHAVLRALSRFGYRLDDWGLRDQPRNQEIMVTTGR
jgi:hypothetical protein